MGGGEELSLFKFLEFSLFTMRENDRLEVHATVRFYQLYNILGILGSMRDAHRMNRLDKPKVICEL